MHLRPAFFALAALLLAAALGMAPGCDDHAGKPSPAAKAPADPARNPRYSSYVFTGPENGIIDMGVQPLWTPTSAITEALRRDTVLAEALAELGLGIRFHPFLKGADVNAFLQLGKLQAAVAGDMPVIATAATSEVVIPILILQGYISIIADHPREIRELRGQRLGYAFGASAHFALLSALRSEGLTERDVSLVPMDISEMPLALARGEIAAFTSWEPNTMGILKKYKGMRVIHRALYSGYMYFARSLAQSHPEAVRHIVAAQLRAMGWMRKSRENLRLAAEWGLAACRDFLGQDPGVNAEEFASLVRADLLDVAPIPLISDSDLTPTGKPRQIFEFMQTWDMLPPEASWTRVQASFDRTILSAVAASPEKYRLNAYRYSGTP